MSKLVRLHINTLHGTYVIPDVDLEKYRHAFTEHAALYNPCLQVINEKFGVVSITWSEVREVTCYYPVFDEEKQTDVAKVETLWEYPL